MAELKEKPRARGRAGKPRFHKPKEFNPKSATPEQTAKECGTSKPTILDWLKRGLIPATICEGRVIRFDLDEVKAALKARAAKREGGAE
jgi:excisionase family DNA binding protein